MSNNKEIELVRSEIQSVEAMIKCETNLANRAELIKKAIELRERYTPLLLKKRPLLLTIGIVFAILYGISLMICLPPYIIRGKKRDINEQKLKELKIELEALNKQLGEEENPENDLKNPCV